MHTITKTYVDYHGTERTETYHFNLTEAEMMEMELTKEGGLAESVDRIVKAKDVPALVTVFKELLQKSYGVISPDGRRFMKNNDVLTAFVESPAYSMIYMELATNDKKAADFVNGIAPNSEQKTTPATIAAVTR